MNNRADLGPVAAFVIALSAAAFVQLPAAHAENTPLAWGQWPAWGDQGDGTYRNPVLPADYSDLDCIRVGSDYYAISSTFQYSPGVAVLHSRDLVNWSLLGHVVDDLNLISPEMDFTRMNRAGRGIWAGAIRHHAGKFWVYFGTPDEGYFMSTADNPAGPWTPVHAVLKAPGWDDCCPFWDDDGQGYLVGTHFSGGYETWLFKLTADGRELVPGSGRVINAGARREASKLFKIDGMYYHFFSEWQDGVGRYVMMQRATAIGGPYTEKRQLSHAQRDAMEPNQGGLVQTEQGEWYFFTHHGTGAWEGRAASLLPVTWIDGWPILGQVGPDGIGLMTWAGRKPLPDSPVVVPQTSDDFSASTLGPQWEWNYQPRADRWSLRERPGYLRLHAFAPLEADNLLKVGNVLTQRSLRTRANVVVARLELGGMQPGQHAGLSHFSYARRADTPAANSAAIGIVQSGPERYLEFSHNGAVTRGPSLARPVIWLRSTWGLDGVSQFSYSEDGETFTDFGSTYQLAWGAYRGDRLGLFTYNSQAPAGFIDIDAFSYEHDGPHSRARQIR